MIVVDIETSGGNPIECGIWQIGAVDLNSMEEFIEEGRIDEGDKVDEEALIITGKIEDELRDKNKQSQEQLIDKFFKWINTRKGMKNLLCHLPEFDEGFLRHKARKYFNTDPFWPDFHRPFDLHTIAQIKFFEINEKFLTKEDSNSDMGLGNIMGLCGLENKRRKIENGKITEGDPHNALEDAKLTAECFSRLVYGKNLFPEFSKFEVPQELRK